MTVELQEAWKEFLDVLAEELGLFKIIDKLSKWLNGRSKL